ncbi:MAG: DHA2 family efflux MFS transporter permease subunit [Actinobacteria bacterium]|nr:DHA2 family efflux MFS transporter permease subunit [Actinomycetota bacterium]
MNVTAPAVATAQTTEPERIDRKLALIASVVVLGSLMSILDTTVVNVAINSIASGFHTSLSTIQWISTGYTLALATVIPLTGWAADRFGTKRLYFWSIAVFLAGSMLSGIAWNAESLIVFRVVQGLGGGMLMPAGMTILTHAAGPHRVGRVMSFLGIPMLLGPIFGPVLGGWLVDAFSWRWVFYINLPIGLIAMEMCRRFMERDVPQPHFRLDWLGFALLMPGFTAVIFGLASTNAAGGLMHFRVLGPALAGVVALTIFVRHSLRVPYALIDLRLFMNRTFAACSGTLFLGIVAVFGGLLLLPLYLQVVRGESAMTAGLLLAPQGLGAVVGMPVAGWLADQTGIGRIVPVGLATIGLAFLGLTQLQVDTSYVLFGVDLFVMGIGMGVTMVPMFSGAMQTLRKAEVARASTSVNITQQVGAAVGTAVLSILLAHELSGHLLGRGGIGVSVTAAERENAAPVIAQAFATTFWWALGLIALSFFVAIVFLPKSKPAPIDHEEPELGIDGVLVAPQTS